MCLFHINFSPYIQTNNIYKFLTLLLICYFVCIHHHWNCPQDLNFSCIRGIFILGYIVLIYKSLLNLQTSQLSGAPSVQTPGVSWLPIFAFHSPIMKRTSFGVLVLKGLAGLHRNIRLQLLQCYWLGHRLWLSWYWMVCLGNKQRSLCHFWDCIQVLHFRLFCWPWLLEYGVKQGKG